MNETSRDRRTDPERRQLFGRRRGHKLRPGRATLMAEAGPELCVPDVERRAGHDPDRRVDLAALFPKAGDVWLEIGFGAGEHLADQARRHPDVGLIGCEHFIDGVASLVARVAGEGLTNVRIHPHDARDLLDALPDSSIGQAFLLYPDPWPKKRHHKRRFINHQNLDALARVMKAGALLRVATDIDDYARHALQAVAERDEFVWTAERADDWRRPWDDWPGTRYEAKALAAGRAPCYLTFQRVQREARE